MLFLYRFNRLPTMLVLLSLAAITSFAEPPFTVEPDWHIRFGFDAKQNIYGFAAGMDMDHDGLKEFAAIGRDAGKDDIFLFEATGNDSYELVWSSKRLGNAVLESGALAVGDSDGDGNLEIVVGDNDEAHESDCVLIFEYDPALNGGQLGEDNPPINPSVILEVGSLIDPTKDSLPNSVIVGDLDDDGKGEVIIGSKADTNGLIIYESTGDNSYGEPLVPDLGIGVADLTDVFDFDNDGEMEIAVHYRTQEISIFSWDGGGDLSEEAYLLNLAGASDQGRIDAGDLDGNGTLEVIVAYSQPTYAIFVIDSPAPNVYEVDDEAGLFVTGDRPDVLTYINTTGDDHGSIVFGYDVGDDEEIFITDHVGGMGSFTGSDFTAKRVLVDVSEEPEGLAYAGQSGTLDGDGFVDLIFGMRSASAGEGEGDEDLYVVEYTGASVDPLNPVELWMLHN